MLIRSNKFPCIVVGVDEGKAHCLDCEHELSEEEKKGDAGFFTGNPDFMFEIYKVLKRAVDMGALGTKDDDDGEETVFV